MKKSDQPLYLTILGLLAAATVLSWWLYFKDYSQKDSIDITKFPKEINSWTSEDLPITEDEYAILETRNVVARRYIGPQGPDKASQPIVYLFMVYSQNNRKVSHPPEICYTGGGVSILEDKKDTIQIEAKSPPIKVNRLLLELKGVQQYSLYWFKVGDTYTPNYWMQQALIAMKTLTGQPHSSALIRISTDVEKEGEQKAINVAKEFTQMIYPSIRTYLP